MSIDIEIEKRIGDFHLQVAFQAGNETLALLGASGCGKSMTLKCIAGIEKPDRGHIIVDGVTLFDSENRINLTPQQRRTGLLFQNYALFPHMTVLQNIQAGACREEDKQKREDAVTAVIERFGLFDLQKRYPHQLSGGQQQRVALARILVSSPNILLLDEPFSALDSQLRFQLEQEVRHVIRQFGKTILLVSHDRDEVYRMADQIAVMDSGAIQTIGSKKAVFSDPKTTAAAIMTGCKNISGVELLDDTHVFAVDWGIPLCLGRSVPDIRSVGIRMHDIVPGDGENSFSATVLEEIENPFSYTVMLQASPNSTPVGMELDKEHWLAIRSETLQISFPSNALLLLHDQT